MSAIPGRIDRSAFFLLVALATALAAWLRTYGITQQVLLDDEWHAIHKLIGSSYEDIFATFGIADHSIPLTLFYKAMADTVGLAEGRLRALQVACGIAFVPLSAWLAWKAARDAPAAALFAFLVGAAPFLVLWSRYARPYSVTMLLSVLCIATVWGWRTQRSAGLAAAAAVTGALAAWFHPLSAMYPAIACVFVLVEDLFAAPAERARSTAQSVRLALWVAGAGALLLAVPVVADYESVLAKAGGDHPGFATWERMLAIIWGGLPTPVMAAACGVAAWGVCVMWRRDPRLTAYLVALGCIPAGLLTLSGAVWVQAGQNFLRYQLPLMPLVLFFGSVGAMSLARIALRARPELAAWVAAPVLAAAYLAATPAIAQVATLGPWYAHIDYHWDYRFRWMEWKHAFREHDPPDFYRRLAAMPPGSAPIIEAPFIWEAPHNRLAYYATFHRQRETFGMLHDLCLEGPRIGEIPPRDRRLRFRAFVFLDDVAAVKARGARYLVLHRDARPNVGPAYHPDVCIEKLTRLYGAPSEIDARVAVFDLRR